MALDHYIPQVHLKRFYSPALDGLMHAVRKSDLKYFTPNSKAVCRIDEGNTNEFLSEPRFIEEFLKPIEGGYNEAVDKFRRGKADTDAIYKIAGFISYIISCPPAGARIFANPIRGAVEMTAELLDGLGQVPPPPSELGGASLTEMIQNGEVQITVDPKYPTAISIANILRSVAMFGNFPWEILVNIHADCPFFTSDYPAAIEQTGDVRILNRLIPLSPDLAVRIMPDPSVDRRRADFEFRQFRARIRELSRAEVVDVNRLIVQSAEALVFFRDDRDWVRPFIAKNAAYRIESRNDRISTPSGMMQVSRQLLVRTAAA